jgi:seryl-tRNA synthetase
MDPEKMLEQINSQLKGEGFTSVDELIGAYQTACAERDAATKARDAFSDKVVEAQKAAREKSGTVGALKQEISDLKTELEDLKGKQAEAPKAPASPAAASKSAADQLAELERQLTDEQWAVADKMLEAMKDEEAVKLRDPSEKLAFLRGLKEDPQLLKLERPQTLRPTAKKPVEGGAPAVESLYEQVAKRVKGVIPGPSTVSGVGKSRGSAGAEDRQAPKWLKG